MKKNENVIWQKNKVSYEDRCRVLGQQGKVVWFTGLSGSGKSTIAVELEKMLNEAEKPYIFWMGIIFDVVLIRISVFQMEGPKRKYPQDWRNLRVCP